MKKKALVMAVLACLSLGALIGCGGNQGGNSQTSSTVEELPDEYNLMKFWAGNPGEEFYNVIEKEDETRIIYEDVTGEENGGWAYVSRTFGYDARYIDRFNEYKKISFTGKMTTTAGSDVVMIKFQGAGGTFEKKFTFGKEEATYELSLNFVSDWKQVEGIYLFVNRMTNATGSGVISLSKMVLSKEEVNTAYDIAPGMPSVPQEPTYYKGEESLSVMYRWGYDTTGLIKTEQNEDKSYKFTWGEPEKTEKWAYVSAKVNDSDDFSLRDSGFKRIYFEFTGTAGRTAMFKFQDITNAANVEKSIALTGQKQEIEIDISKVLAAEAATEYLAVIFPDQDNSGASCKGELTLTKCILDKNETSLNENISTENEVYINVFEKYDSCYTVEKKGTNTNLISFEKMPGGDGDHYQTLLAHFKLGNPNYDVTKFTRVSAKFTASVAVNVLVKAYDNNDGQSQMLNLKANEPYELSYDVPSSICDISKAFVLFVGVGSFTSPLKGTLLVENLQISVPQE